jgi:alpha,alpha-trehalose-phosphate synthase [UDP-forming]
MNGRGRLLVVSNRLPVTVDSTSGGGLVTALMPIVRESRGSWIGWTGSDVEQMPADLFAKSELNQNSSFVPVFLTAEERASYYRGFSNEIIWPLFHSLPSRCQFDALYWNGYCKANEKFADATERIVRPNDFIWVHDYHLMLLAEALRKRGIRQRLAYFHHIPFPSPDIFETLPWREEVLRSLMQFNLLGFQTLRDRRNFIACLRRCLRSVRVCHVGETCRVTAEGQSVNVGTFPVSIDYEEFNTYAARPEAAERAEAIHKNLGGTQIILGIDRLDYTKGIPERLNAFERLIEMNPQLRGRVTLVQVVVPSREDIPEYKQLQLRIETLISKINGAYSVAGWVPIHYFYRSFARPELIAFYRASHIAMVTPLRDGMNLVAKEFCASRVDNRGVLVLSEFAGAADELGASALLVNPYDSERVASVLEQALRMNASDQQIRMERMRAQIRSHDVFHWFGCFSAEGQFGLNVLFLKPEPWSVGTATAVSH